MAGRRPTPKNPEQRRRRNGDDPVTVVANEGKLYGDPLPDTHEWPQSTLDWWETWRTSALASKFTATDWSFLIDTAVLHAEFWLGNRALAGELRLRVAKFGATVEDRARLKLEIGEPGTKAQPTRLVTKESQSRKTRLLRAVGDGES